MFVSLILGPSAALAIWYGASLTHEAASLRRAFVKTCATSGILIFGLWLGAPWLILLGLVLGVLGDAFLSRPHEAGFVPGLAAFLIGHICYVLWTAGQIDVAGLSLDARLLIGVATLAGVAGALWRGLQPVLGAMKLPVALYICVSLALAIAAMMTWPQERSTVFVLGVLAFVASDIILAIHLFLLKETSPLYKPAASLLWALYWSAQLGIVQGAANLANAG